MRIRIIITGSILLLSACAKTTAIQPINLSESEFTGAIYSGETARIAHPTPGEDQYRVFHKGATGFISVQTIRASAERRAAEFCIRKDRRLNVIQETTSTPPHILGNWPRIELVFECLVMKTE